LSNIEAISLDFYNTLVYHRTGQGRGAALMEYLQERGLESDPWEHQVLYDIFEPHGREYGPQLSDQQKRRYWRNFSQRLFRRLNVRAPEGAAAEHAADIWRLLGPSCLSVFPDALQILPRLKEAGFPLALVSNWQCGLRHFCADLGLAGFFDHVLASAEVGSAKPDAGIFLEACRRLNCRVERVLHVGDSYVDDYQGGSGAGLEVLLLLREAHQSPPLAAEISDLGQLAGLLGLK
jgi:HAD superfamily hydrolase (TIGR01549 family)